jgi:hypothetical protein
MLTIESVIAICALIALAIWLWPALNLRQAKEPQPKKRKPSYLIDRISTDGLKRARTVHDIRVKNTNKQTNRAFSNQSNLDGYAVLLRMLLNDVAKANRLIDYEIKKGAKSRGQAIKNAIESLKYDKSR